MSLLFRVSRAGTALVPALALTLTALGALMLTAPAAHAQANLTFTGGSGRPLTLTLAAPVTYTITTASAGGPVFVFDAVGNPFAGSTFATGTGTLAYYVNNGPQQTINYARSGFVAGDVTADDIFVGNSSFSSAFAVGDQIVLSAGTFTTTTNVPGAASASNSFTTFVTNNNGTRISSNGVSATSAVPEPGTIALLLTAGVPVAGLVRRRQASNLKKAAATA